MTEEFNLSDKIFDIFEGEDTYSTIETKDVKEFIRRLENEIDRNRYISIQSGYAIKRLIKELAGDKLI